jgi:hypothetical protein
MNFRGKNRFASKKKCLKLKKGKVQIFHDLSRVILGIFCEKLINAMEYPN